MNIMFIDTDKYPMDTIHDIYNALSKDFENLVIIPKDFDLLKSCSREQLVMVRDAIDKELKTNHQTLDDMIGSPA